MLNKGSGQCFGFLDLGMDTSRLQSEAPFKEKKEFHVERAHFNWVFTEPKVRRLPQ